MDGNYVKGFGRAPSDRPTRPERPPCSGAEVLLDRVGFILSLFGNKWFATQSAEPTLYATSCFFSCSVGPIPSHEPDDLCNETVLVIREYAVGRGNPRRCQSPLDGADPIEPDLRFPARIRENRSPRSGEGLDPMDPDLQPRPRGP